MNIADMVLVVAEANPNCKQFRFKTVTHPALTKKESDYEGADELHC